MFCMVDDFFQVQSWLNFMKYQSFYAFNFKKNKSFRFVLANKLNYSNMCILVLINC